MTNTQKIFLQLVRLGIGQELVSSFKFQSPVSAMDWEEVVFLAERHGLSAVLTDGIECLPKEVHPPKLAMLQLIGTVLQNYEARYKAYESAVGSLAAFYNRNGFKMMVLKGYACALDWPKPKHRPCGDIDIWLFGAQKEADEVLSHTEFTESTDNSSVPNPSKKPNYTKIAIDNSHHHHTVFNWKGFMVENHYDFINVHAHSSSARLERIFKKLGALNVRCEELYVKREGCKNECIEVDGAKVYLPSPNLHALFLIRHSISHFASTEMNLRQILDWAFFVEKHGREIDWEWLIKTLEEFHMKEFFNCLNAICVERIGFEPSIFPKYDIGKEIAERILNDTLFPEFSEQEPKGFFPRVWFKFRRWKAQGWKRRLCYKENALASFFSGVWAHVLKPSSI